MSRSAPTIDPTTVVQLSDPGVELTAPADGRLRSDGTALVVTGAALTEQAGAGNLAVSAGAGNHLIVFAFRQVSQNDQTNSPTRRWRWSSLASAAALN